MTALIVTLLVTGAALLVAEAHLASYGALGIAGIAVLALAGVLAVDAAGGSVVVALAVAVPVAAGLGGLLVVAVRASLEPIRRRAQGGADGLIGRVGVVRRDVAPVGDVFVDGALWRARRSLADDDLTLHAGDHVVVERVHGLTLSVRRADEWEVLP